MCSRNGTPISNLALPVPSRLIETLIWVSRVLRSTDAVRSAITSSRNCPRKKAGIIGGHPPRRLPAAIRGTAIDRIAPRQTTNGTHMDSIDTLIIGAGALGLTCAARLSKPGQISLIVEAESLVGRHTSSRNSEVIHAGIYYAPG